MGNAVGTMCSFRRVSVIARMSGVLFLYCLRCSRRRSYLFRRELMFVWYSERLSLGMV